MKTTNCPALPATHSREYFECNAIGNAHGCAKALDKPKTFSEALAALETNLDQFMGFWLGTQEGL